MTEEELFGNTSHSTQFEEFLAVLGQRVSLQGLEGYAGTWLDLTHFERDLRKENPQPCYCTYVAPRTKQKTT